MKMTKKKVFIAALAICLVAILSLGTLAWFSDDDALTNKFYIAESTDLTEDSIFSVDVTEVGDGEDDGLEYQDVHPGDELDKETKVTNTSDDGYDQYIRVTITIEDRAIWEEMITEAGLDFADFEIRDIFVGFDSAKWDLEKSTLTYPGDTIQYVIYYKDIVAAGQTIDVFDAVAVPTFMTREHAAKFNNSANHGFNIDVKAEAVQSKNIIVADGEHDAYDAFKAAGLAA